MSLKFCFKDQKLNQVLAQSTLARFMADEIVRVLGCDAKKGDLHIHWLAKSECVTFSFRDQNDRIVPGTPEFNPKIRWDLDPLLTWTAKDFAAQPSAMELFYAFLESVKTGLNTKPDPAKGNCSSTFVC